MAFARSAKARRAFSDGIVWIRAGLGADSLSCMRQLGLAFDGAPDQYLSMEMASVHLPRLVADKVCLVVLDDVWNLAQLTPIRDALVPAPFYNARCGNGYRNWRGGALP